MDDEAKTRKLSVRLLKSGIAPDEAMKEMHGFDRRNWTPDPNAVLYTGTSHLRPPKWDDFLREGCPDDYDLRSNSPGALLFIPVGERWLAISFGYGLYLMKSDVYELNFGLRCALNSIEPEALKSLDISTPEMTTIQRRIQTSQAAELGVFGIATEKDILKKIQGRAKDEQFAKNLTGADALTFSAQLRANDLGAKCTSIISVYGQDSYKEHFGWVDHIGHVKDKQRCEELDSMMLQSISNDSTSAHLAPPEIVDPESVECFRFAGVGPSDSKDDLLFEDYLSYLQAANRALDVDGLKKHKVLAVQDDSTQYEKWTVYKCLVFEVESGGCLYVLSGGNWYCIEQEYAAEVNSYFDAAMKGPDLLDAGANDDEDAYIASLSARHPGWTCLHTKNVRCKNWSSPIEPCDFLTDENEFVHIKNSSHSATLSHLFAQGTVSAEAFKREPDYRAAINARIQEVNPAFQSPFLNAEARIDPSNYSVVFAVMRKPYRSGSMGIPFFSKVAYRYAKTRLDDLGFQTKFSWVRKN